MGWGVKRLAIVLVRTASVDAATGVVSAEKTLSGSLDIINDQIEAIKVIPKKKTQT